MVYGFIINFETNSDDFHQNFLKILIKQAPSFPDLWHNKKCVFVHIFLLRTEMSSSLQFISVIETGATDLISNMFFFYIFLSIYSATSTSPSVSRLSLINWNLVRIRYECLERSQDNPNFL